MDVHEGKALLGHVVDALGVHIDEKFASSIVIFKSVFLHKTMSFMHKAFTNSYHV